MDSKAREQIQRLIEPLRVMADGGPPILESWLGEYHQVLRGERSLTYGVRPEGAGFAIERVTAAGGFDRQKVISVLGSLMADRSRWGYFDAGHPEPQQRNRPVEMGPYLETWRKLRDHPRQLRARWGISNERLEDVDRNIEESARTFARLGVYEGLRYVRVLACEGDALLSWVSVFRSEPFTPAELRLVSAVTPFLVRRLSMERLLESAPLTRAALTAALEQIARPAFLLRMNGTVAETNTLGRLALERSPADLRRRFGDVLRGAPEAAGFRSSIIEGAGVPRHLLAVEAGAPDVVQKVDAAAQRWGLTPREKEVLGEIAKGQANKAISLELRCSEKTVELYVTRLLRKAEVDSRAALIARLWTQGG